MPETTLVVTRKDQTTEYAVDPGGILIGRSSACSVVLESSRVSRQHARIFQDSFGRWIVEDLGGSHGVLVGGRRIRTHALLPGEQMTMGPFTLVLRQPVEQSIDADPTLSGTATRFIESDSDMQVVRSAAGQKQALPDSRLKELRHITSRLEELTSPAELYPEVCRCLADRPDMAALVVRLSSDAAAPSASSQILARRIGVGPEPASSADAGNLCLSRRVLDAVRGSADLVMAKSVSADDAQLTLTITDACNPRAVLCASLGEAGTGVDALYLDVPLPRADADYFELIQAVVHQMRIIRKYLFLIEAKSQRRVLDEQLSMARRIQDKLTPTAIPNLPAVDVAFYYNPALWVGGDYCDLWLLPDGRLAFAVGDVSGKGLPAAMVMSNLQAALRTATLFCPSPSQTMDQVNRHLLLHLPDGMFVTMFLGFFDSVKGVLEYVNAGHVPPLLIIPETGVVTIGDAQNTVLGITEAPFVSDVVQMTPGTALLSLTDGITESRSPDGGFLGIEPIEQMLAGAEIGTAQAIVDLATQAGIRFRGTCPQQDDVTVLCLLWQKGMPGDAGVTTGAAKLVVDG